MRDAQKKMVKVLNAASKALQGSLDALDAFSQLEKSLVTNHFHAVRAKHPPKGWKPTKLGTLFEQRKETGFTNKEILAVTIAGEIVPRESLERSVIDKTGTEKYYRVDKDDIVYNTMRMWQGSCGIAPCEGLVSPAYTVLQPSNGVRSSYWNLAFHSPWMLDVFTRFSVGVASDRWRLYYRDFKNLTVNVAPEPLQASAVEQISAVVHHRRQLEEKAERERELLAQLINHLVQCPDV